MTGIVGAMRAERARMAEELAETETALRRVQAVHDKTRRKLSLIDAALAAYEDGDDVDEIALRRDAERVDLDRAQTNAILGVANGGAPRTSPTFAQMAIEALTPRRAMLPADLVLAVRDRHPNAKLDGFLDHCSLLVRSRRLVVDADGALRLPDKDSSPKFRSNSEILSNTVEAPIETEDGTGIAEDAPAPDTPEEIEEAPCPSPILYRRPVEQPVQRRRRLPPEPKAWVSEREAADLRDFEHGGAITRLTTREWRVASKLLAAMGKGHLPFSILMDAAFQGDRRDGLAPEEWLRAVLPVLNGKLAPLGLEIGSFPKMGAVMREVAA